MNDTKDIVVSFVPTVNTDNFLGIISIGFRTLNNMSIKQGLLIMCNGMEQSRG